jgi:serine protease AprX
MAKQRVIAYFMHEPEKAAAVQMMTSVDATDSFVVGDLDQSQIPELQAQGLIINKVDVAESKKPEISKPPIYAITDSAAKLPGADFSLPSNTRISWDDLVPHPEDFYKVSLNGPLLDSWREQLSSSGISILARDSDGAYKARLTRQNVADLGNLDFVAATRWISPEESLPVSAPASAPPPPGPAPSNVVFDVRLHIVGDLAKVQTWLTQQQVAIIGASGRKIRFSVQQNSPVLGALALLPEVDTIAEYIEPVLWNDGARRILGVDPIPGPPPVGLSQDGTGEIVVVADTGIDQTHPDFAGRILSAIARGRAATGDASDPVGHGTHVSGSILGDGTASGGLYKGMAPKAKLIVQSLLDASGGLGGLPLDLNDLFEEAYLAGGRIHNNSWGAATGSTYAMNSEEVDEFVRRRPDMLIVIAAGNAGSGANPTKAGPGFVDWLSISSPASCKNALTVGASRSDRKNGPLTGITWGSGWPSIFPANPIAGEMISGDPNSIAAFSSRGPCDDRRIKPDVVAPGTEIVSTKSSTAPAANFPGVVASNPAYAYDNGTSMATPLVAGCAALVRQYFIQDRSHAPSAALLKATLINSTQWLTGSDANAPDVGKPNYHQGHGRIDMRAAIPNPTSPGLQLQFEDDWQDATKSFTRTGERRRYQFILAAGVPDLRICMAYTDAPARSLQNNLNLIVQDLTSGKKWMGNWELPNPLILPDPDNNVEVVKLQNPAPGPYMIQVFAGNLLHAPQDFALVATAVGLPALVQI